MAGVAKMGWLLGPPTTITTANGIGIGSGFDPYTDSMILRDVCSTIIASILAGGLSRMIGYGYENNYYTSKTSRKLSHTLSAPLYILFWPCFSSADGAKYFAGLVTFTNLIRLYIAGKGDLDESSRSLVKSISRSGDTSEALGGPLIYVCLFQFLLLMYWRTSFIGVVAMTTMAAGDGMADIIGRRYGTNNKWNFGENWSDGKKSKIGTVAFAVSSFICTTITTQWLLATGCLATTLSFFDLSLRIVCISCICSFIEILPFGDDNYTVPGCAALLASLLLR